MLGVPDRLGSSLDVLVDLVVVGRRKDAQVGESVEGDRVRGSGVAESDGVARDRARGDRVGRLGSEEETVAADDLERASVRVRARRACLLSLLSLSLLHSIVPFPPSRHLPRLQTAGRNLARQAKRKLTASAVKVGPLKTSRRARVWSEGCL